MAQKTVYVCDGCGTENRAVNSWWMVKDFLIFELEPFELNSLWIHTKIYCGQQCVIKAVSEYMDQKVRSQP